jgi:hypothetical protein
VRYSVVVNNVTLEILLNFHCVFLFGIPYLTEQAAKYAKGISLLFLLAVFASLQRPFTLRPLIAQGLPLSECFSLNSSYLTFILIFLLLFNIGQSVQIFFQTSPAIFKISAIR